MIFNELEPSESLTPELLRAIQPHEQVMEFQPDVEKAWKKLEVLPTAPRRSVLMPSWRNFVFIPAAVVIVVTIGLTWDSLRAIISSHSPNPVTKTFSTVSGQRAKINLADGSEMLLAPVSIAKVNGRTVELTGEALFTVTHDGGEPFIVRTGSVTTRVLGTSFSVRRLAGDSVTRVIVAQGRIALADAVLSSGDIGIASDVGKAQVHQAVNIGNDLAWTTGRLAFERESLREIIPQIHRWYGFDVLAPDALMDIPVSTWLPLDNPREAMSILATLLVADVSIAGTHVTFKSAVRTH